MAEVTGVKDTGFKVATATAGADPSKQSQTPTIQNAPFQIRPLGNRTPYIKALWYGAHGSGKTTLAGTSVDCEPMRDVLMVDAESGELAIQDNPRIHHGELISHVPVTTFKQVAFIHQFLQAHCIARDANDVAKMKKNESMVTGIPVDQIVEPKRYRTVIIDSLTEIDQYSLYALKGMSQDQLLSDPGEMEKTEWKEYGKNNEMVKMLVRAFRDLPMNVIFVCSIQYNQNERKQYIYSPALTGKLSTQVQGMVDMVGYMVASAQPNDKGELPRRMFIQPGEFNNARFDAKNRRAQYTQGWFDDPTMQEIMTLTGMMKRG
jgi:hypothetical protein